MVYNFSTLLVGKLYEHSWMLPQMLHRAGAIIDSVSFSRLMQSCKFVRKCWILSPKESLVLFLKQLKENYDWIIITDEVALAEILHSNLSLEEKLKFLPVTQLEHLNHINSKIGLSIALSKASVPTPLFRIANSFEDALDQVHHFKKQFFVKIDQSSGGSGVFECQELEDLYSLKRDIFSRPVLLQEKIIGKEVDLSSLFLEGELIYFQYASMCTRLYAQGPCIVKSFRNSSHVDPAIQNELQRLGKCLSAHGFLNISAIEDAQGKRFYFEADMRPNVLVDFSRFIGEDPAKKIAQWFQKGSIFNAPAIYPKAKEIKIPYFLRMPLWQIVLNYNNVWKYIPRDDPKLIVKLLYRRFKSHLKAFLAFFK